ncbi:uncharacterized protein MYCFIDRAFT_212087 [Pseudocercospora fijiensis CIRAD86]|uniref:Secreted protein n=1 Tax=Pseudocercospora fijiensis (strain CIRAD86) TaxID=383855 RepID=M3ASY5_PSEFD|nr:uncharacterized protein MYCFIDRAFT_212087 [Pseudocercospora fijiensis CIRAD86]EME80602.1 hypothetical protein MYCFIDRAFT_212087 [Pseudocercospora fijiensis CIRAD86]
MKPTTPTILALLASLTSSLPTKSQRDTIIIPEAQLVQARAFAYTYYTDATFRLDISGKPYYTPTNTLSWPDYAAYVRAYGNYLCSLQYVAYCGDQPTNFDRFARRPTCWQDPEYYNSVADAWRNPADFWGARRVDPYTGEVFTGGLVQCKTDAVSGGQSCVA